MQNRDLRKGGVENTLCVETLRAGYFCQHCTRLTMTESFVGKSVGKTLNRKQQALIDIGLQAVVLSLSRTKNTHPV
jgi:hypothetical protein